jgi:hypothetical protein
MVSCSALNNLTATKEQELLVAEISELEDNSAGS